MSETTKHLSYYKGTITSVIDQYCAIILNKTKVIHLALYCIHESLYFEEHYLPALNETVIIKNAVIYKDQIYLNCNSELLCENFQWISKENLEWFFDYLTLIKKNNLTIQHLEQIHNNICNTFMDESNTTPNDNDAVTYYKILNHLSKISKDKLLNDESKLPEFNFQSLSDVLVSENIPESIIWSYKQLKNCDGEYLISYLSVSEQNGMLLLKDKDFELRCIITNKNKNDLRKFVNRKIAVLNYVIFKETYQNDGNRIELFYIVFDASDVVCLSFDTLLKMLVLDDRPKEEYKNNCRFILLEKFIPNITSQGLSEQYLLIQTLVDDKIEHKLLHLQPPLLASGALLEENCSYKLFYNENLSRYNPNKTILKRFQCFTVIDKKAIFVKMNEDVLQNVSKENILKNNLISFVATIFEKKFTKPLTSNTSKYPKIAGFNTPGKRTHGLELIRENNEKNYLYLNNWEPLQTPIGLIPNMKIMVKNVAIQKNKYFKSCSVTSFTVMPDVPKLPIIENVSPMEYITLKPEFVEIDEISIDVICEICNELIPNDSVCPNCDQNEKNYKFKAILLATTQNVEYKILVDNIEKLPLFFSMLNHHWTILLDNLENFVFKKSQKSFYESMTQKLLNNAIRAFNLTQNKRIQIDCFEINNSNDYKLLLINMVYNRC